MHQFKLKSTRHECFYWNETYFGSVSQSDILNTYISCTEWNTFFILHMLIIISKSHVRFSSNWDKERSGAKQKQNYICHSNTMKIAANGEGHSGLLNKWLLEKKIKAKKANPNNYQPAFWIYWTFSYYVANLSLKQQLGWWMCFHRTKTVEFSLSKNIMTFFLLFLLLFVLSKCYSKVKAQSEL